VQGAYRHNPGNPDLKALVQIYPVRASGAQPVERPPSNLAPSAQPLSGIPSVPANSSKHVKTQQGRALVPFLGAVVLLATLLIILLVWRSFNWPSVTTAPSVSSANALTSPSMTAGLGKDTPSSSTTAVLTQPLSVAGLELPDSTEASNSPSTAVAQPSAISMAASSSAMSIEIGDKIEDGIPAPGAGVIETPGKQDVYTFTATPGQKVYFRLLEYGEGMDYINWRLVDENDTVLFDIDFYRGEPGVQTLQTGGTYIMTVGNESDPATGSYALRLEPTR
jgi:hypothetical protein